jgi:ubiquinone/menaquinone biosynthesis C-methylase UbiE
VLAADIAAAAGKGLPLPPEVSCDICRRRLTPNEVPGGLSRLHKALQGLGQRLVGTPELQVGYNAGATFYEQDWLSKAKVATDRLIELLDLRPGERVLDAGCGTGYTTRLAARAVGPAGRVKGVDISDGMLKVARERAEAEGLANCELVRGELLGTMAAEPPATYDACTCTWVVGYVGVKDLAERATHVLRPGGRLGIVCNAAWSPKEILAVATRMLARHPWAMRRAVSFPFPSSRRGIAKALVKAGFEEPTIETGTFVMQYASGRHILEQFERSGEAEVYRKVIDPAHYAELMAEFAERMDSRYGSPDGVRVTYEYFVIKTSRRIA